MQDPNTPQGQVQETLDFSGIAGIPKVETPVQESAPQTTQEQPQNEFIIVDGEKVEVNLDEIIGNQPDGTPIKLRETDNPKSYKYFQARDSKKERRLKELEDMVKSVQKPAEVKAEPKPEPPTRPEFPKRPKDYDATEAVTNPDSPSYQYERMKEDYYIQRDTYDRYVEDQMFSFKGQIESEKQQQMKSQQELAYQAKILGEIQQVGGVDASEAKEIWDTYSTPKNDNDFLKDLIDFHHFKKGQKTPQAQRNIEQFNRNGQRQNQYVPPPGVIGSQSAPEEPNFGDTLLQVSKKYRL